MKALAYVSILMVIGITVALLFAVTGPNLPTGSEHVDINPQEFSTNITNEYFPLPFNSQKIFEAVDGDETEKVVVTVLDKTKTLKNGVEVVQVRDTVYLNGKLHEDTIDYFAQDDKGNVWYFGEQSGYYEDGKFKEDAGSFEAGVDKAEAGIAMPAKPKDHQKFRLEYKKGVAEDNVEVIDTNDFVEVENGFYTDVVVTRDTGANEPKVNEHKFYAKGTGVILSVDISDGEAREQLVDVRKVKPGTVGTDLGNP